MSIFDVIKYGNINIESEDDLNQLPCEVVKKWHARVVEHACQSAESVAHQDTSGKCQVLIDMTRKFMRGEVNWDAAYAAYNATSVAINAADAANAAYYAASAAYNATSVAINAAYAAAYAVSEAINADYEVTNGVYSSASAADAVTDAIRTARNAAMKLYKEWLMEELMAYDSEEFCD